MIWNAPVKKEMKPVAKHKETKRWAAGNRKVQGDSMRDDTLKNVRAKLATCVCELLSQSEFWHADFEVAKQLMELCGKLGTAQQRQNQLDAIDVVLHWKGTGKGRVETILELLDDHSSKHE